MAGTIEKLKAKVDNVLHKDKTTTETTGAHSSHAANVADPRVDSNHTGTHSGAYPTGTHTGTDGTTGIHGTTGGLGTTHGSDPTGPHDSHLGNKVDPRVDSDRYGTAGNTATAGGHGTGQYGSSHNTHGHNTHGHNTHGHNTHGHNTHGTTGGVTGGNHTTHGTTGYSDPTGPHDSHLANKADPRVDSDRYGAAGNTATAGGYGTGQYGSAGTHGTHGTTGHHGTTGYSDPTGPHDSHLANRADPRVDSDRYGAAGNTATAGGYGTGQYGSAGTHGTTGTHATHGTHGATPGSGTAQNTAGPHNSDLLNKLDPRVDSDLNGSKTTGGNATYR